MLGGVTLGLSWGEVGGDRFESGDLLPGVVWHACDPPLLVEVAFNPDNWGDSRDDKLLAIPNNGLLLT